MPWGLPLLATYRLPSGPKSTPRGPLNPPPEAKTFKNSPVFSSYCTTMLKFWLLTNRSAREPDARSAVSAATRSSRPRTVYREPALIMTHHLFPRKWTFYCIPFGRAAENRNTFPARTPPGLALERSSVKHDGLMVKHPTITARPFQACHPNTLVVAALSPLLVVAVSLAGSPAMAAVQ